MRKLRNLGLFVLVIAIAAAAFVGFSKYQENLANEKNIIEVESKLEIGYQPGDSESSVTREVRLPTSLNGATITWSSNDSNILVVTEGRGIIQTNEPMKAVTLTAKIESGKTVKYKTFNLVIRNSQFEVSFDGYENFNVLLNKNEVIENIPVPNKDGFIFMYWSDSPQGGEFDLTKPITSNLRLYPIFEPKEDIYYTVEHYLEDASSGSFVLDSSEKVFGVTGNTVTANAIIKQGYQKTVHASSKETGEVLADNSLILKVYYRLKEYTVSFDLQLGTANINSQIIKHTHKVFTPDQVPQSEGRHFLHWSLTPNGAPFDFNTPVLESLTLYAVYDANIYTVEFYSDDVLVDTKSVIHGNEVSTLVEPEKDGYTFSGWDQDLESITANLKVNALFEIRSYSVRFFDFNSELIEEVTVNHFEAATPPVAPMVEGYSFISWSQDLTNITGPLSVRAQYEKQAYTVKFYDQGELIDTQIIKFQESAIPPSSEERVKAETPKYRYEFIGWTEDTNFITNDLDVHAKYEEIIKTFTYRFVLEDGVTIIKSLTVDYGTLVVPPATNPLKDSTAQYHFNFAGYQNYEEGMVVENNITFTAIFEPELRSYQVVYKVDGSTIHFEQVNYGSNASAITASKEATADTVYTFRKWDQSLENITSDLVVNAEFDEAIREYEIKFINYDDTILESKKWAYGEMPSYQGTPTQPGGEGFSFTHVSWTPKIVEVTQSATYKAVYEKVVGTYKVEFFQDGEKLAETRVNHGETAHYPSIVNPTKEMDEKFIYQFSGWDQYLTNVTEDIVVNALFTTTTRSYNYEIISNGQILNFGQVLYNTLIPSDQIPNNPNNKLGYHFVNWKIEDVIFTFDTPIKGNVVIEAYFEINEYTIKFVNHNNELLEEVVVEHGTIPTYSKETPVKEKDVQFEYSFAEAWTPEIVAATEDATYQALFNKHTRSYQITFKNDLDEEIETISVLYGEMPTITDPTKEATAEFTYTFVNWNPVLEVVTGDATYIAIFQGQTNKYLVKYMVENEEADSNYFEYGAVPTYIKETPTKASTVSHDYEFVTWTLNGEDVELHEQVVTDDVTYIARFKETDRAYTVTWNVEGVERGELFVYNSIPEHPTTPTKAEDSEYSYEFLGWSLTFDGEILTKPLPAVVADVTLYAVFKSILQQYTITFNTDGGSLVESITQEYTSTITQPQEPTKEGYTFAGWNPQIPETMPANDMTITATWTINTYNLIIKVEGQEDQLIPYEFNAEIGTLTDPNRTGYTFVKWNPAVPTTMPASDYTVTAEFNINQYTISFDSDGGTAVDPITQNFNSAITAPVAPTKVGYTFSGWNPALPTIMPAEDMELVAIWQINQYTIDFDSNGGTPVVSITKDYNSEVVAPYPPSREGHTFAGWLLEEELYNFSTMPATNLTLVAKWDVNNYSITYVLNDGVKSAATYLETADYNTTLTFTTEHHPTKEGFYFKGWTVHNITVANPYEFDVVVKGDVILIANWLRVNKTIEDIVASGYSTIANELDNENVYLNKDTNNLTLDILVKKPSANVDTYLTNLEETLTNLYTNSGADTVSVTLPSVSEATTFKDLLQQQVVVTVNKTVTNFTPALETREIKVNFVKDYYEVTFEAGEAIDVESFDPQAMVTPALDTNNILDIEKAENTLNVTFHELPANYQIAKVEVIESGVIVETITPKSLTLTLTLTREITQDTTIKVYIELVSYRVKFEKDELYETQIVKHGKLATEPSYKIKDGYIQGWYEKVVKNEEENNDENDTVQPIEDVAKFDFTQPILKDTVIKYFENVTIDKAFENAENELKKANLSLDLWMKDYNGLRENYADYDINVDNHEIIIKVIDKSVLLVEVLSGESDPETGMQKLMPILTAGQGELAPGINSILKAVKESGAKYFNIPIDPSNPAYKLLSNFGGGTIGGKLNGDILPISEDKMTLNIVSAVFGKTVANLTEDGYFGRDANNNPLAPQEVQLFQLLVANFEIMLVGNYPINLYGDVNGAPVFIGSLETKFEQVYVDLTTNIITNPEIANLESLVTVDQANIRINPDNSTGFDVEITQLGLLSNLTQVESYGYYRFNINTPDGYKLKTFTIDGVNEPLDFPQFGDYLFIIKSDSVITIEFVKEFSVKFFDENNVQIGETQTVENGKSANAPEISNRDHYTWSWNKEFTNVQSDLEVQLVYTPIEYEINYNLKPNETNHTDNRLSRNIESQTLELKDATKDGYLFGGWFTNYDLIESSRITTIEAGVEIINIYPKFILTIEGELIGEEESTYDPNSEVVLTVEFEHPYQEDITISWYKNGVLLDVENGKTLSLKEVKDTGFYKVILRLEVGLQVAYWEDSKDINITPESFIIDINDSESFYGDDIALLNYDTINPFDEENIVTNIVLFKEEGSTVGEYQITATYTQNIDNYLVTVIDGTYTIKPKSITVTPNASQDKMYGDSDPGEFEFTWTPLVGNDKFTGKLSREAGETVASYKITQGDLTLNDNYIIEFVDTVEFTINPKPITVTINDPNPIEFLDNDPDEFTYEAPGLREGDVLEGSLKREEGQNVGSYKIDGELTNPNYNITIVNGLYTITKAEATINIDDKTSVYGDPLVELTATVSGLVGEDNIEYTLNKAEGLDVGEYSITASITDNPNYTVIVNDPFNKINGIIPTNKKLTLGSIREGTFLFIKTYSVVDSEYVLKKSDGSEY